MADRPDDLWLTASIIKVPIGLEFFAQVERGALDPRTPVTLGPDARTPGPTGISLNVDPVTMSLRDLGSAILTISDNAATEAVGRDAFLSVQPELQSVTSASCIVSREGVQVLCGVDKATRERVELPCRDPCDGAPGDLRRCKAARRHRVEER